jgi:hypothetical protein
MSMAVFPENFSQIAVTIAELQLNDSVANWQKFRLQNTKVAPQKYQRPEKSAAEFLADFYRNGRKVAELFLRCVNGIKSLINARNRLFNTLMNSTFLLLFWPEVFEKQPLCKDNVCGRIFSLAAELFGEFGRQHLPGVGNTA